MKRAFLGLVLALFAGSTLAASAQSTTWTIDPVHSQADFEVRHMSVSKVRGAITNVTGLIVWDPKDPSKDSVNAVLSATTINSGSNYRDKDVKGPDYE